MAGPDVIAEHKEFCKYDEENVPELSDAQRIVDFINQYNDVPEEVTLVVHCHGGVSRAAAVAKWAAEFYRLPLWQLGDGVHRLDGENPRVLRY